MAKGEETRQRIIEQAAPVFNRLGFGSTSMSELMAVTGLEKGGIYRHFESKEELACAAFEFACEASDQDKFGPAEQQTSGLKKLERFVLDFGSVRSKVAGGCPIFNTAVEHDDGNPKLKKLARTVFTRWTKKIASFIDEAKSAGELKKSVVSESLAGFIFCSLEGALVAQRLTGDKDLITLQSQILLKHIQSQAT